MSDLYEDALSLHRKYPGKLKVEPVVPLANKRDLSLAYSPGVAAASRAIHDNPEAARELTIKQNSVAVVSDGSAVLGLGNIGPLASLPVMEGKAALFKTFGGIDAYPIVLDTQNPAEIVQIVKAIAPGFGGINLEDISAPRCFEIESALQSIGIPVFHDDQHGTAIVVLGGLLNAAKVVGKSFVTLKVVIVGAGAAGTAIATLLSCLGDYRTACTSVKSVTLFNRKGQLTLSDPDLSPEQRRLLDHLEAGDNGQSLEDALHGADVFIGVSGPGVLTADMIKRMAPNPLIFALANPDPEIDPAVAKEAGAAVVATGRSDYPNQVNNVLAFPGVFRGALDARAARIDDEMKIRAGLALAESVPNPTAEQILPSPLDKSVADRVAKAVQDAVH